ncbi:MAG: AAA family ATPase [Candidatus Rokubacteria bacterium]|nr:AAA family ATPase [Candidatus Rokubacteria bacterium]
MAKPGSALITASTLRLAEGYVEVRTLGPVRVKGLAEPVEVFELAGAGVVRTRLQAASARGLTRFVGRQAELEALRQALERARGGRGQVVAVVGEPGVGKSRLFYEFTRSHRTRGWLLLEATSASYGKASPYLPVIGLLRTYFQAGDRDDPRRIREKVTGKVLTLDPALHATLPAFLALLDVPVEDAAWQTLDPARRAQQTTDACKRLLLRESRARRSSCSSTTAPSTSMAGGTGATTPSSGRIPCRPSLPTSCSGPSSGATRALTRSGRS